jgi:integrase
MMMPSANQLDLFSVPSDRAVSSADAYRPDADSERFIASFRNARLSQGAHSQSVRREVSQLRAVMREAGTAAKPVALPILFADLDLLARVLREPQVPIARSTGRGRLVVVQRFMLTMGHALGRDAAMDLVTLDALLPARRSTGWHTTGALVAGTNSRRRRRGPTLDAADLWRIVEAVGIGGSTHMLRDRALVALHCFSGLRPEEIVRLRWEALSTELSAQGHYGLTAAVMRAGRSVCLLVPSPASDSVEALAEAIGGRAESLSGPVFCARGAPGQPLSYRTTRDVLHKACRRAGLPPVESSTLRAACAHWLRSQGLSDHEVASVLGFSRVRSVDRLLQQHTALDSQRTVRERLG